MNVRRFFMLLLVFLLWEACGHRAREAESDFAFLVLSDTHISSDTVKTERLRRFVQRVNRGAFPGVELLFITGDVVSNVYGLRYTPENPDTSDNRVQRVISVLSELQIPYYLAMGNHDHKIASFRDSDWPWPQDELVRMQRLWKRMTGFDPYYAVEHKGWKFIVLNSMGGRHLERHFDDEQMDWLERELAERRPSVLFFHHPIRTDSFRIWSKPGQWTNPERDPRFYEILKKHRQHVKAIFVGHGHFYMHDVLFESIPVYETDSFGEGSDTSFYLVSIDRKQKAVTPVRGEVLEVEER